MSQKTFNALSWGTIAVLFGLVLFVWGDGVNWKISSLNAYQWFPLFGLIAWTFMAAHYYLGTVRLVVSGLKRPRFFKPITGYIVLASILLHPGLLAYQQSENGLGGPPGSFESYVGEGLKLAVMLGTISLIIFLSFEVFERVKNNSFIKRAWPAISISQSLAMILIWIHGLRLGTHLGDGWFQVLWVIFGIGLVPCFYIIHRADFESH